MDKDDEDDPDIPRAIEQQARTRGRPRLTRQNFELSPSSLLVSKAGLDTKGATLGVSGQLGRERERRNMERTWLSADGAIPLRFSPSRRARQRDKTSHGSREMRRSESDLTETADTILAQVPRAPVIL